MRGRGWARPRRPDVHRPALQRADRRPCLWHGAIAPRVRHGLRRDVTRRFTPSCKQPCRLAAVCRDGAIAFVCMDWRHMRRTAGCRRTAFGRAEEPVRLEQEQRRHGDLLPLQHELVFVFKVGAAPHANSFGLGDSGRYRTNVWDYPGISSLGATRQALAMHPTVKPTRCRRRDPRLHRRNETVLDLFGGSRRLQPLAWSIPAESKSP